MKSRKLFFQFFSVVAFTGLYQTPALGAGGVELTQIGLPASNAQSVFVNPDGSILAAGSTYNYDPISALYFTQFAAARYRNDGALDTGFNASGMVATTLLTDVNGMTGGNQAFGAFRQTDGKSVVAGTTYLPNDGGNFGLVRYNTDGSLDSGFGASGTVATMLVPYSDNVALGVVGQSWDGKIVAAGRSNAGTVDRIGVARYNPNGSLDSTFGAGGIVITTLNQYSSLANAVVTYPTNRLLVAGRTWTGSKFNMSLVRYTSSGSLDTTFGGTGKVSFAIGAYNDEITAVTVQSDGKIVVAGHSQVKVGSVKQIRFAVLRLNANGSLDTTFGSGGKVILNLGGNDKALGVVLQSDGKIVAAGYSVVSNASAVLAVVRLNANGSSDNTFGSSGRVLTPVLNHVYGNSVALDATERIVVGGTADDANGNYFMVARYLTNGTLDTSF